MSAGRDLISPDRTRSRSCAPTSIVALVAGEDEAEVRLLGVAASALLAEATTFLALEVGGDEVDAELAWGTRNPCVRTLAVSGASAAACELGDELIELPLPETGDVALAVLEAARRVSADLVVAAGDRRGRLARLFSGSATDELVQDAHLPVLIVPGTR